MVRERKERMCVCCEYSRESENCLREFNNR